MLNVSKTVHIQCKPVKIFKQSQLMPSNPSITSYFSASVPTYTSLNISEFI